MKETPVLVAMPLFNAMPFVSEAIESILEQTFPDFVFLIINDGSTDESAETARSYCDDRIVVLDQPNSGPGAAMNRALAYAKCNSIPLIARMDADDISHPERLRKQISLLQSNPQAAACSANAYYIDSDTGERIGASTISGSSRLIRWEIFHGLRGLIQGACMFRTEALHHIGGYREMFRGAEEVDVFLRLAEQFELVNCMDYLYKIRLRANSFSLENVRRNVGYQFFALDCAERRRDEKPERSLAEFEKSAGFVKRAQIWREVKLLNSWRESIGGKRFFSIVFAAMLDPRRVMVRVLRKLDALSHQKGEQ